MQANSLDPKAIVSWGQDVLRGECDALEMACGRVDKAFVKAVELILQCEGKVVVTGLGKSGLVGQKIASTLSSTGTPSFFLHASEALHGDSGMISTQDCVVAIAYGGETREVLAVAKFAKDLQIPVIGLTGRLQSSLAQVADCVLDGRVAREADGLDIVPTASSTVAMALGDALAVALMRSRGFSKVHFAKLHPGGQLGLTLTQVKDFMRARDEIVVLRESATFTEVLQGVSAPNFGIVGIVDVGGILLGAISDGDLRRALLQHQERVFHLQASKIMTSSPKTVGEEVSVLEAVSQMERAKITSLFVMKTGNPSVVLGMVRLHDLLAAKVI
jgi:arabinose-5-phosphate isomerase